VLNFYFASIISVCYTPLSEKGRIREGKAKMTNTEKEKERAFDVVKCRMGGSLCRAKASSDTQLYCRFFSHVNVYR
jgi:hypothetical protein